MITAARQAVDAGSNLNRERPIPIGALYWVYWVFVTTEQRLSTSLLLWISRRHPSLPPRPAS